MTKKNIPLKPHVLKSKMGLFSVDGAWLLVYPNSWDGRQVQEPFSKEDDGIIELLWTIKEEILGNRYSKHNIYNIVIKRVKVKK